MGSLPRQSAIQRQIFTGRFEFVEAFFQEEANSAAMIRHAIDVVSQAVQFPNPGQVS